MLLYYTLGIIYGLSRGIKIIAYCLIRCLSFGKEKVKISYQFKGEAMSAGFSIGLITLKALPIYKNITETTEITKVSLRNQKLRVMICNAAIIICKKLG